MKLRHFFTAAILGSFFLTPALAVNFDSDIESGFFKKNAITTEHFRFEFSDLIESQSDSDSDGVADTIEVIATAAEHSFEVLVEDMGYPEPNADVDRKIVVILDDNDSYLSAGALGITSLLSSGDPYVAIDPFLSDNLLKVTMAHELFHVIQFDMGVDFAYTEPGINLAEATATWSEEQTYDDINDHVSYLGDFFDYPDYSVFSSYVPTDTLFEYALSIWYIYLEEQYDEDVMLHVWEAYQSSGVDYADPMALYEVLSDVLADEGSSLNEAYIDFALWNLDLDFYSEGSSYPQVILLEDLVMGELTLIDEFYAPALYGSNYLYFDNAGNEDGFYFQMVKPDGVHFAVTLVPVDGNDFVGEEAVQVLVEDYDDMEDALALDSQGYDGVVAIVSALDADFEAVSDPDLVFDEGFLYYYLAQYGEEPVLDPGSVEVDETGEKEGEESSLHEEVRNIDTLTLDIQSYDEESVTLSWNRPDSEIAQYEILTTWEDGEDVKLIEAGYITTSTLDALEEGVNYSFQIYAYDDEGEQVGEESNEIAVTTQEWIFSDLSFMDSHYDAISSLVELGIFQGYPDGSFQPNGVINRAELLKILIEGQGIEVDANLYKNCFPDVNEEWFAKYVCYSKHKGWISGYPDGTYKPGNTVNKVEALKILFNVYEAGLTEGTVVSSLSYPDVDKRAWYAIYVWEASAQGILEETPGENFNPAEGRIRGDMAESLYRYLIQLELIEA